MIDNITSLTRLGFHNDYDVYLEEENLRDFEVGRVVAEHRERYRVISARGEHEAEITGNLRFSAAGREDFPAVGDWVAMMVYDPDMAIIHRILPRFSMIRRKAAGKTDDYQVIAANIDHAFIVQAADRDFNINRLERYITICHASGVNPVAVLSKTDLAGEEQLNTMRSKVRGRHPDIPLFPISSETRDGYGELLSFMEPGKTYCLLGSSGAGKSTLLNNLTGKEIMQTGKVSQSTGKGQHVTSHRELVILGNGSILIDNPGMREVGIGDADGGLEMTFGAIAGLAESCRYRDCTHTSEAGCAVVEAVEKGEIDPGAYDNYLKMLREQARFETSEAERRKKDKTFGKIMKNYKKDMRRNEH